MINDNFYFPHVTLLITHYNRSRSLENLLRSFSDLGCRFGDIVVSDDCSDPAHLKQIIKLRESFPLTLVASDKNGGLGHNINKGQDRVNTPYTLYVQEDFTPCESFPAKFKTSLAIMEEDKGLDIVRFWSYFPYPYLRNEKEGFYEMYMKPFARNYHKIYCYGDTPHLRRSSFLKKFGRYQEGISGDRTEYKMCISFIQNRGRGLFYKDCRSLFVHENTEEEPSTMHRVSWRQGNSLPIRVARNMYRQVKYNLDIHFKFG